MHRAMSQKPAMIQSEKGRGLRHMTLINFGVPLTYLQNGVELETSNLVHRRTAVIPHKTAKKDLENGRGLGHVTPIIFGVHTNVSPKREELET